MSQKIWFTSDNHFYHKAILNFCRDTRQGNSVDEMNELLIAKWNSQVALSDIVYCLGDFSFGNSDKTKLILDQLNGQLHLIKGNHEHWLNNSTKQYFEKIHNSYHEITIDDKLVVLCHYPIAEHKNMHYGSYHLYGHVHNKEWEKLFLQEGRRMDVGIDARPQKDMGLFSWEEIVAYMEPRAVVSHHG